MYAQMKLLGESLQIMWLSCGYKLASPTPGHPVTAAMLRDTIKEPLSVLPSSSCLFMYDDSDSC